MLSLICGGNSDKWVLAKGVSRCDVYITPTIRSENPERTYVLNLHLYFQVS